MPPVTTSQQYGDIETITVNIDTNLSGKEMYLVNLETTGDKVVNLATDASAFPFVLVTGVDGSSTEGIGTIAVGGRVKVKVGGSVTAGAKLTSNGSGLAIATTTDTDHYGLIALEDGSANDVIDALIAPGMVAG